jgi:hypothetical protein
MEQGPWDHRSTTMINTRESLTPSHLDRPRRDQRPPSIFSPTLILAAQSRSNDHEPFSPFPAVSGGAHRCCGGVAHRWTSNPTPRYPNQPLARAIQWQEKGKQHGLLTGVDSGQSAVGDVVQWPNGEILAPARNSSLQTTLHHPTGPGYDPCWSVKRHSYPPVPNWPHRRESMVEEEGMVSLPWRGRFLPDLVDVMRWWSSPSLWLKEDTSNWLIGRRVNSELVAVRHASSRRKRPSVTGMRKIYRVPWPTSQHYTTRGSVADANRCRGCYASWLGSTWQHPPVSARPRTMGKKKITPVRWVPCVILTRKQWLATLELGWYVAHTRARGRGGLGPACGI